jgi:hypothetical protein
MPRKKAAVKEERTGFIYNLVVDYLRKDRERAQEAVAKAFPNSHIHADPVVKVDRKPRTKKVAGPTEVAG